MDRGRKRRAKKMFRYEVMWESHEEFGDMLAGVWQNAGKAHTLSELHNKLTSVAGSLSLWNTHTPLAMFGGSKKC